MLSLSYLHRPPIPTLVSNSDAALHFLSCLCTKSILKLAQNQNSPETEPRKNTLDRRKGHYDVIVLVLNVFSVQACRVGR